TSMPEFGSAIWFSLVTSIIAGVGIGVLAQPQLVVRFMTVKNNRDLNRALVSGSIFILVLTGAAYMVGALSNVIFFRDTGSIPAVLMSVDRIIPYFINTYMPSWFVPVFFLTLLSAAMSTLSAQFHTMGISLGYDLYQKGFEGKKNSLIMNKVGVLVTVFISALLAYGSSFLEISTGIIAAGTALFMGLCAAAFLPTYVAALFSKTTPRAAAIASIVSGTIMSLFWMFFIHAKNAANLQLCKLLTGKSNLVAGTSFEYLSLVDSIMVSLPLSIIVLIAVWLYYKSSGKMDIPQEHIEKCFKGM
ncbi:hypothetical protein LJC10_06220, partial [Selenomonadales bacterium OttesenSCG-928-I06]|nr:hypothetical protein [Selenomonadales bacterium OttesenSCG-928-I06]